MNQMKPHQLRVVIEKAELDIKILALQDFIKTSPIFKGLSAEAATLLEGQVEAMIAYSEVLQERIGLFADESRQEQQP